MLGREQEWVRIVGSSWTWFRIC